MNPEDLARIRFVARNFRSLQGLERMVPVGLVILGVGLLGPNASPFFLWLVLLAFGTFLLMRRSRRYYLARFGEVESQPRRLGDTLLSLAPMLLVIALDELGKRGLYPRDLTVYPLFGLLFLWCFFSLSGQPFTRPYGRHYLGLGALFLGLAVVTPARSLVALLPGLYRPDFGYILGGLAWILAGLLDHQLLVRSLGQVTASFSDAADAADAVDAVDIATEEIRS